MHQLKLHALILFSFNSTGVKPYKCSICLKSFRRKDALSNHKKVHDASAIVDRPIEIEVLNDNYAQEQLIEFNSNENATIEHQTELKMNQNSDLPSAISQSDYIYPFAVDINMDAEAHTNLITVNFLENFSSFVDVPIQTLEETVDAK